MAVDQLLVFSSTPDVARDNFVVPVLAEPIDRVFEHARDLGFDGLEFLPNPDAIPDADRIASAARSAGASVGVINTGRLAPNGYAILHKDGAQRRRSIDIFKGLIDLAGALKARVGLGMARGDSATAAEEPELSPIMRDVFGEIAERAVTAGTMVMLEPADPGYVAAVLRVHEAVKAVEDTASPGFSMMLDTYQLDQVEDSIEEGFRVARGLATHIHLYDHGHWPPGVRAPQHRLDWRLIRKSMETGRFQGSGATVLVPTGDVVGDTRASTRFIREMLMSDQGP